MFQATTRNSVFSVLPTFPTTRPRLREFGTATPDVLPTTTPEKDSGWFEAAYSFAMLCMVAGAVLASTGMLVRMFVDQLMRYRSFDLLRGMGVM